MSLGKRIKSIQLLEYCLMHSWAVVAILVANLAFTWFFIMMGKISGFFDIVTLILFPFLLLIGETAMVLFATFSEICAEMVADTLFPRYVEVPAELLVPHEPAAKSSMPGHGSTQDSAAAQL